MSLSIIPKDVLFTISGYLAENPKDLIQFGRASKLTHEIANNQIFKKLLQLSKEEFLYKKCLSELRGPTGFDGLVDEAWRNLKNAEAQNVLTAQKLSGRPDGHIQASLFEKTDDPIRNEAQKAYCETILPWDQAARKWDNITNEFYHLAQFQNDKITGGKIYDISVALEDEIKYIREFFKNRK